MREILFKGFYTNKYCFSYSLFTGSIKLLGNELNSKNVSEDRVSHLASRILSYQHLCGVRDIYVPAGGVGVSADPNNETNRITFSTVKEYLGATWCNQSHIPWK